MRVVIYIGCILLIVGLSGCNNVSANNEIIQEYENQISSLELKNNELNNKLNEINSKNILLENELEEQRLTITTDIIDNPIDNFFKLHPNELSSHIGFIEYSSLYSECWMKELLNVYKILIENTNSEALNDVIKSRDSYIDYVERSSLLNVMAYSSNAYSSEEDEEINIYGDFWFNVYEVKAKLYQEEAIEIIDCLEWSEIDYEYIFNPDDLEEEMTKFKSE